MTKTLEWLQQFTCGLHGHDAVLHFERHRLSLRCLSCGHQTVGWNLLPDASHREKGPDRRGSRAPGILPTRTKRRVLWPKIHEAFLG